MTRPFCLTKPFAGALEQGGCAVGQGGKTNAGQVSGVGVEGDQVKWPWRGVVMQPVRLLPVRLTGDVEEGAVQAARVDGTAVDRFAQGGESVSDGVHDKLQLFCEIIHIRF